MAHDSPAPHRREFFRQAGFGAALGAAAPGQFVASQEQKKRDGGALPLRQFGHLELYKSTMRYDGDVGREQHGMPLQAEVPL
jgi:hypothetical protein